ncbi:hypothetical protein VN0614_15340 [Helicobacter pylori]|nr:hypothetical protein VN0614_15340 [Helicobacter pylori]
MEARSKKLRDNVLKNLIMLYTHEHDELKGYEVLEYKAKDNTGNIIITAILKKIGSSTELKAIKLDLKILKSLLIDVVINELWRPLLEWECELPNR